MHHSHDFLDLVNDSKTRIKEISIAKVQEQVEKKLPFILLDVRENDEWVCGHLPSAIHLPRGILERDVEKIIPDKSIEIVVYCAGGYRSALAADALQKMNYSRVWSMSGGIKAWKAAGYSIQIEV